MDERERALRKLAAAAEHERDQAELLAAAVPRLEVKVTRAREHLDAAEQELAEARTAAAQAQERASAAHTAWRDAADGVDVTAHAGVAAASAEAS